eukprot:CAMPEP_0201569384 /NCGR_PEP_ID=MMETSP0190_2-20130828/11040_1 /ASSEMBLY_ACC=CAM_ASM_000263 /TAXON_ID=37353 /ORGANISM="Rosalina sp." /LENGTH=834 /DNA_ID=CAMNT_0047991649 /DNA_START=168 /DNA_END=2673 /DNA_ORIENTATION=+
MNGGSGGNNPHNVGNKAPQIHDAKEFLERVKLTFKDDKGVYDDFVEIMKNFKHDHINTGKTIQEVKELFSNHPDLFDGFKNFLPSVGLASREQIDNICGNNGTSRNGGGIINDNHMGPNGHNGHDGVMAINNTNPNTEQDFNMAVTFICKIKQRFGSHRKIYQDFLQILQHFQTAAQANDTTVIKDVKMRIRSLFREHPDLLDQFDYFLPPLTAHFSRAGNAQSAVAATNNNEHRPRKRHRDNQDELDNERAPKRARRDNKKQNRNQQDADYQPSGFNSSSAVNDADNGNGRMTRSRKKEKDKKRDRKRGDRKDRHHGHRSDRGDRHKSSNKDRKNTGADQGIVGLSDDEDAIDFTDTDEEFGAEDNNDGEHQGLRIFSKLRKDIPDHLYRHVLTLTQLYPMGLTEFSVVGKLICDALREHGHTDLMKEFQKELQSSKQSWFFRSRGQNYYEYLTNNMLLKSCKAIQSSYRQLPQDVVQPRCSGRHPDAAKVLNDYYVSKPTGGEGGGNGNDAVNTAGGRLKNQHNENLQKSEDDLFELDMMIQTNDAARKRLEQLYKTVMQPKSIKYIQSNSNIMEIPPVERRAISRLYSEHGNKVLNLLKKMPETTIPVVLKRLREKSQEWEQLKNEMKAVWKQVATKNYYKAHDFRFTLFKSNDAKRIQFKNICKQIEERHQSKMVMKKHMNFIAVKKEQNTTTNTKDQKDKPSTSNSKEEADNDDDDIDMNKKEEGKNDNDENEDEDIDLMQDKDDKMLAVPDIKFDSHHHSFNRIMNPDQLDPFETDIAAPNTIGIPMNSGMNGEYQVLDYMEIHHMIILYNKWEVDYILNLVNILLNH